MGLYWREWGLTKYFWGFPWSWGYPNSWLVYNGKTIYKWMIWGYTLILGNLLMNPIEVRKS